MPLCPAIRFPARFPSLRLLPAICGVIVALAGSTGAEEKVTDIGTRRELFVDRHLVSQIRGAELRLHPPRRAETALKFDSPWDGATAAYVTVFRDGDLFRMYSRYAQLQGWKIDLQSASPGDVGGYKEIIANVEGDGVYGRLKWESGVHRVQRVPATETQGRVHTSAASVAVLPAPEDVEIEIRQEDIRIDTMRASGSGGQHVNTTDSAVRITHLPTGIVATSSEKSQHVNRDKAMQQLKIRLYEKEKQERDAERAEARASQVGSGDRSEKIRTYNYPENRVTDHRIGLTLYSLDKIIAGDKLEDVVEALMTEDQARRLAAMEDA